MTVSALLDNNWIPPKGDDISKWRPLPDTHPDWFPAASNIEPFDEIRKARACDGANREKILSNDCISTLERWWSETPELPKSENPILHGRHFHCYPHSAHRSFDDWTNHANCNTPGSWWCHSIKNAAAHYSWTTYAGGTFEQLAIALQSAISQNSQRLAQECCLRILDWGGVLHRSPKTRSWINRTYSCGTLIQDIKDATALLCPSSNAPLIKFGQNPGQYPMNAGSTKIFSAAALDFSSGFLNPKQDVLIFDGRVGAALGLITRRLFHPNPVAAPFRFPRGVESKRDPSRPGSKFPAMSAPTINDQIRATFARTASKAIQETFDNFGPSTEFALAEKALFMLGYDVTQHCGHCQQATAPTATHLT